jgi:predicted N-formylglutamate amidohydrolase
MRRDELQRLGGDGAQPVAACERIAPARADAPLVLSSEHASSELPPPWSWPAEDQWLRTTHWASDLGAAELTRELAAALGAAALLGRFSRLLIDPNRPLDSPSLFRSHADGRPVALNHALGVADAEARVALWQAYHHELDQLLRSQHATVLLAVHSYTPSYQGQRRDYPIGVLFDREEELARALQQALSPLGEVRLNEPYSGKAGLIYAAQRHADATGKRAVEIEVRQDVAVDPRFRERLVAIVAAGSWLG